MVLLAGLLQKYVTFPKKTKIYWTTANSSSSFQVGIYCELHLQMLKILASHYFVSMVIGFIVELNCWYTICRAKGRAVRPCLLEDLPSYNNKRVNKFQHLAEIINKMGLQSFPDIVGQLFVILAVICGENQLFCFDPAGGNCLFTHPPMGSTLPVPTYCSLFQPATFRPLSLCLCQ